MQFSHRYKGTTSNIILLKAQHSQYNIFGISIEDKLLNFKLLEYMYIINEKPVFQESEIFSE